MRVVLDTNVLISAVVFGGNPQKVFDLALKEELILIISSFILFELRSILAKKFAYSKVRIDQVEQELKEVAVVVEPKRTIEIIKKDPADNRILECALESKAGFIVSGDKHLLSLGKFKRIKIVSPLQFLKIIGKD